MINLQIFSISMITLLGIVILLPIQANAQTMGSVTINLSYTNGDRADYWPISLKIYQDINKTPYRNIESLQGNPFNIVSLPVEHQYKIETYSNGLHASVDYVNLQQSHEDLGIKLPLPGGIRLNAFYNDGVTPISNATVYIRSLDNKTWAHGSTDVNGKTMRFWIAPTVSEGDHYIADVRIGDHLLYSQSPLFLEPGVPQEIKILTNWPPVVNNAIIVKVFDTNQNRVSKDNFVVDAFESGNKISEAVVTAHGEAYFSNIKVGDYQFKAIKTSNNSEWGDLNTTIDGTKTVFSIYKSHIVAIMTQTINQATQIQPQVLSHPTIVNCNCVAFRLDNIQDYWLNSVQIKVMDIFYQKNVGPTLGIIGNAFGNDSKLTNYLKTKTGKIDLAINGWNFEDFTAFNQYQQQHLLKQSKDRLISLLGVTPSVFIPPYGKTNNNTIFAMSNNDIGFLSGIQNANPPQSLKEGIHILPAKILVEYSSINQDNTNDAVLSNIKNIIHTDGFAIVTIKFQDYAQSDGIQKINMPDATKIQKLEELIDKIKNSGIKIVTIKEIDYKPNLAT